VYLLEKITYLLPLPDFRRIRRLGWFFYHFIFPVVNFEEQESARVILRCEANEMPVGARPENDADASKIFAKARH
jgi:hypothetical protein